jgi:lysophospholipase L1-like esterase
MPLPARRLTAPLVYALSALALNLPPSAAQEGDNPAAKPTQRKDDGAVKLHETFVETAKKGGVDVLFVGDSITAGWKGGGKDVWKEKFAASKPANFGIGGDRTDHVLWRITEGKELDGIDPKVIVLMIGTNNISAKHTPEQIAGGVKAIVGEFRKQKPNAKVLLLGVFPRGGKQVPKGDERVAADDLQPKIKQINDLIAKLDDGKHVKYLDIGEKFKDEQGGLSRKVMPDFLHLSAKGYEIWADAIVKPVEELLK